MKKLTALFLAVFMAVSLSVNLYAADFDVSDYKNPFTDTAYTEDSFYGNGTISIILSHEASIEWREYTKEDFPELELDSVDTKDPASTDKEFILGNPEYRNFVHITLVDKSNEAVIKAINVLYNNRREWNIYMALSETKTSMKPIEPIYPFEKPISKKGSGDVNGDSKVNLTDASSMLKHIAKWEQKVFIKYYADVNDDGIVNLNDATLVLQKIAGWDMPGIPANEFIQKLADDYTKYMEKEYNHDTEKNGIFRVSRYYGTYGNAACVMIIGTGMDYHGAFWSETVAGSTIHYNYGNSIIVCVNGEIFSMTEAYENGYLTTEQVSKIAEINNKGKYIEYSIGF